MGEKIEIIAFVISIGATIVALWKIHIIEKWKRDHQKQIFIHKCQFEKEFSIYTELWSKLIDLGRAVQQLRPIADSYDATKTEEQVRKERLELAAKEGNAFIDLTDKNKPFYAEDIFLNLEKLNKLIIKEIVQVKYRKVLLEKDFEKYWNDGENTMKEFNQLSDNVCNSIRERIRILETLD